MSSPRSPAAITRSGPEDTPSTVNRGTSHVHGSSLPGKARTALPAPSLCLARALYVWTDGMGPSVGGGWPFAGVHWEPPGRGGVVVGSVAVSSGIGIPFVILHFFRMAYDSFVKCMALPPLVSVPTGMIPASAGGPFQIGPPRFALTAPVSSVKLACSLGCGSGHPVVLLGSSPFGCLTKRDSVFFPSPPPGFPYPSSTLPRIPSRHPHRPPNGRFFSG